MISLHPGLTLYLQLNIISLATLTVLAFSLHFNKVSYLTSKFFKHIIYSTILMTVLHFFIQHFTINYNDKNRTILLVIITAFGLIQASMPQFLFLYSLQVTQKKISIKKQLLVSIPSFINYFLILINNITNFCYTIDEIGVYHQQKGFIILALCSIFYWIIGIVMAFSSLKKATDIQRTFIKNILIFAFMIMTGLGVCILINGFFFNPFMTLSLLFLYINVQSKQQEVLNYIAYTDSMTGCHNKTSYNYEVSILSAKIQQRNYNFAIIIFDANNLKIFNDTLGHDAGDVFIKNCATFIKESFINSNVYRIGGDEFVVFLKDEDFYKRDELLDNFDRTLADKTFTYNDKTYKLSISRGMAVFNRKYDFTYKSVFDKADKAMYEDKKEYKQKLQLSNKNTK